MASREIDEVKHEVAVANRLLAEFGLSTYILASLGHVSLRVPNQPELFVVKGRGYAVDALAAVRPEEMIVVDMEGNMVDGPMGTSQCHEVKMHSCILREHPEVMSVCHVHPRFTGIMGLLGTRLQPMCNEGHALVRDGVSVYPHSKLIVTEADGMEVVEALGDKSAVILRGHGAATVGPSLEDSVMTMLMLEEQARMNWYAACASGGNYTGIPEANMDEFAATWDAMHDAPHLKGPLSTYGGPRRQGGSGGVWTYYSRRVSTDL